MSSICAVVAFLRSYWGYIDTHGFAIISQLRALFPAVNSFLMDHKPLFAHKPHWGRNCSQGTLSCPG